jgi:hypothetical protein
MYLFLSISMKKFAFSFKCDQNPVNMELVDGKKKCVSCNHLLTDYTGMTAAQITNDLKINPTGCCFMFPWQEKEINDYLALDTQKPNRFSKLLTHAAVVTAPLLLTPALSIANKRPATEQTAPLLFNPKELINESENNPVPGNESTYRFKISFRVNKSTTVCAFSTIGIEFYDSKHKLIGTVDGTTDSTGILVLNSPFMEKAETLILSVRGKLYGVTNLTKSTIFSHKITNVVVEEVKYTKRTIGMKKVSHD